MLGKSKERGRKTIDDSLHGLSTVLAATAALICGAPIFEYTFEPVYELTLDAYGEEAIAWLSATGFGVLSTAAVFFIARIFIVISLTLIASRAIMFAV